MTRSTAWMRGVGGALVLLLVVSCNSGPGDCLGLGKLDEITVALLEPYDSDSVFAYDLMSTPFIFGDHAGTFPSCGTLDDFAAGTSLVMEIGPPAYTDTRFACDAYSASVPAGPPVSTVDPPFTETEYVAMYAGAGGDVTFAPDCEGTWVFVLGAVGSPELTAEPVDGDIPPRVVARAFRTADAAGCEGLPGAATGPHTCADVWAAQVTSVR